MLSKAFSDTARGSAFSLQCLFVRQNTEPPTPAVATTTLSVSYGSIHATLVTESLLLTKTAIA
jgi:hypothetical protein